MTERFLEIKQRSENGYWAQPATSGSVVIPEPRFKELLTDLRWCVTEIERLHANGKKQEGAGPLIRALRRLRG
ncbi:MAG: hypothetical protein ACXVY6_15590 [Gaiellaceae bacterium]